MNKRRYIALFAVLVTTITWSCHARVKEQKPEEVILSQLDNLDSLDKLISESPVIKEQQRYDSAVAAIAGESSHPLRQLYYSVHDFYGYLADVQRRFYIFCGDKDGQAFPGQKELKDSKLTNAFFAQKGPNDKYILYLQLKDLIGVMESKSRSKEAREAITRFKSATTGAYRSPDALCNAYFTDAAPVAAIVALKNFELHVKEIETIIIHQKLNN